jgi:hypothetical protein
MSSEESNSNVKDVIDAATGLVKAVPIYDDLLQPAAKELGAALGTLAKTVNLALAPISGLIWSYETIKDFVSRKVAKKLQGVPESDIETPNPMVAGPALEALKYAGHEEILREMYANLLANALDKNTKNDAHPSFVEIIKQISPNEARLLVCLSNLKNYPTICAHSDVSKAYGGFGGFGGSGIYSDKVRKEFSKLCLKFNIDLDIHTALDNFRRLRILDIETNMSQSLRDNWRGRGLNNVREISETLEITLRYAERLYFTSFGVNFIKICVRDKGDM